MKVIETVLLKICIWRGIYLGESKGGDSKARSESSIPVVELSSLK